MKTYEEMARDVLKRRDKELQNTENTEQSEQTSQYGEVFYPTKNKKRGLLSAIALPCAAALAIGAVTVGIRYGRQWLNWGDEPGAASEEQQVPVVSGDTSTGKHSATENSALVTGDHNVPDNGAPIIDRRTEINFLDDLPEYLLNHAQYRSDALDNLPMYNVKLTMEEMNSWFNVELDRLSRLHNDWKTDGANCNIRVYGGEMTDPENIGDYMLCGRAAVWEINGIVYDFKKGGHRTDYEELVSQNGYDVFIFADHIGVLNYSFDPFDSSICPDRSLISYVNGREALIYHIADARYDAMRANIKYGQTLVTIEGFELSEEEFIEYVEEFTSPEYDIEITPWENVPKDHLTATDPHY